jgi:hypothetical protein
MRRIAFVLSLAVLLVGRQAPASVLYHLDNGLPPGTGLYAQVEFASPPASSSAGWSVPLATPGFVIGLTAYNLVAPEDSALSALVFPTGPLLLSGTVGSAAGATLDSGMIFGDGAPGDNLEAIEFNFGPNGAGSVTLVYYDRRFGGRGGSVLRVGASGTWVLGPAPAPVPEPAALVLASFPIFFGLACAWRRRRRAV